jgi:preprotein translocase subunit SecD
LRTAQKEKCADELVGDDGINAQQRRFVAEYLKDGNATQAAIRAGYSEKTAEQIGYQLLQKTSVAQAIAQQQKASIERTLGSADEVLRRCGSSPPLMQTNYHSIVAEPVAIAGALVIITSGVMLWSLTRH